MKIRLTAAALAIAGAAAVASAQHTPLMGWSSWNTFALDISEDLIKSQADAMVATGLKDAGYEFINIDDGYWNGRAADGALIIDSVKFPNGMRHVADYIHSKGLKAGIYSDAGHNTCGSNNGKNSYGRGVGLYGHEAEDCKTYFVDWDYDFIKVDYCGASSLGLNEQQQYTAIAEAIANCGRSDIRYNLCRWAYPGTWAAGIADSWRTTGDIYDAWRSVKAIIDENLYLSAYCRGGHYNDMDMLEVGRSMSPDEDATHFAMWCIMSSPLLMGCDMSKMSPETIALVTNPELIALNQDPLHLQAYVAYRSGDCYVMVKDVDRRFGKNRAIAVYNPSDEPQTVELDLPALELGGDVTLRDLLNRRDLGKAKGGIYTVGVPAHGVAMLKATASKRLERSRYEGECGYISDYQEVTDNTRARTGIYMHDAACSGGVKAGWLGYSEENDLRFDDVYSLKGGEYDLTVVYLSGEDRKINVEVNGTEVAVINANSGGYDRTASATVKVKLRKGVNSIRFYNADYYMPDIDYFELHRK